MLSITCARYSGTRPTSARASRRVTPAHVCAWQMILWASLGENERMKRVLAALTGVLLTHLGAGAVLAFQRATGSGQTAAAVETQRGSGAIVVDWNQELVRIVNTPGAQPATVHPTRSFAI